MNVQCTSCKTVFRVDPRKVPAGGVRARCSICRAVFDVPAPPAESAAAPVAAAQVQPSPTLAPAPTTPPAPTPTAAPAAPAQPVSAPAPPPAPAPRPQPVATPAPAPAPAASRAPSPFGASDPPAKARRLARALISDIVTYFPDRRERAIADGKLRTEFKEEITKSWQEYMAQVGADMAKQTPYFREALNEILAKGQQVF